jgi:hypothetical protein
LEIYALVAAPIFAVAGLFIFIIFAWFEMKAWHRRDRNSSVESRTIGISVALPNTLANGVSDNE